MCASTPRQAAILGAVPLLALLLLFAISSPSYAGPPAKASTAPRVIGVIQKLKGEVRIVRGESEIVCHADDHILEHDGIRTGRKSSVGIVFCDETIVTLGPDSQLLAKEFVFKPADGICSFAISLVRGTFVYISGQIAKLAPEAVLIETPIGAITVRGTRLLIDIPKAE